jgi:hypothetical protein
VSHYLTISELSRVAHTTPGNEALADLLAQIAERHFTLRDFTLRDFTLRDFTLRVDLDKLLRKPDETKGSLPPP